MTLTLYIRRRVPKRDDCCAMLTLHVPALVPKTGIVRLVCVSHVLQLLCYRALKA